MTNLNSGIPATDLIDPSSWGWGGGTIWGTIAANQVGYWSALNTLTSDALFTRDVATQATAIGVSWAGRYDLPNLQGVWEWTRLPNGDNTRLLLHTPAGWGSTSLYFGGSAGNYWTESGVGRNTGFGNLVGSSMTSWTDNSLFGHLSGSSNTTGAWNTFLGSQSWDSNTIGNNNTFLGFQAGLANIVGSSNTIIWVEAWVATINSGNTFMGYRAWQGNTSGTNNVFLGIGAGSTNTTGVENVVIGAWANVFTAGATLAVAIGVNASAAATCTAIWANAICNNANSIALGRSATTTSSNQMVVGATFASVNNYYFGQGQSTATPSGVQFSGTDASAANTPGWDFVIWGGRSTGTANPSVFSIQTTNKIAAGTWNQSYTTVAQTVGLEDYMWFHINRGLSVSTTNITDANFTIGTTANLNAVSAYYGFNGLTAARTLSLPPIANIPQGMIIVVKNEDDSVTIANTLTIDADGTDVIDWLANYVMDWSIPYESITLIARTWSRAII